MKIWNAVKSSYAKVDSIVHCAILYLVGSALDIVSSLRFPPGFEEANPFSRHPDGSFWLRHALIVEGFSASEALLASAGCYVGARVLGERPARFAAGLPWLYFAWGHLDAAYHNTLLHVPGLYVQTYHDMFRSLLGY